MSMMTRLCGLARRLLLISHKYDLDSSPAQRQRPAHKRGELSAAAELFRRDTRHWKTQYPDAENCYRQSQSTGPGASEYAPGHLKRMTND
jgi:hypothetical protein